MNILLNRLVIIILLFNILSCNTPGSADNVIVYIKTTAGDIKVKLYDETPIHRDNFVKLINSGFYEGVSFHRVIKDFMIQAGDPLTKPNTGSLPDSLKDYTIPAEFYAPLYHKKGALAAARSGDNVNPNRESSGSQFYIVQGKKFTLDQLQSMENSKKHIPFTEDQKIAYTTLGGTPHLDYAYTVFGEVIEGLEVVDAIALAATDERNRPLENISILKASILK